MSRMIFHMGAPRSDAVPDLCGLWCMEIYRYFSYDEKWIRDKYQFEWPPEILRLLDVFSRTVYGIIDCLFVRYIQIYLEGSGYSSRCLWMVRRVWGYGWLGRIGGTVLKVFRDWEEDIMWFYGFWGVSNVLRGSAGFIEIKFCRKRFVGQFFKKKTSKTWINPPYSGYW